MDDLDELKLILNCIYNESDVGKPIIPFFSFEGLPGAGKTTQIKLVSSELTKTYGKCAYIDLPTKSGIGQILKSVYTNKEIHWNDLRMKCPWFNPLMITLDLHLALKNAALSGAKFALMSRGILSTFYYNLDAYGNSEMQNWKLLENHLRGFYKPTAIIYMDLPIEEAHKRVVIRNRGPLRKMDSVDQMHKDQYKLNEFLHRLNTIPTHFIDAEGSQVEVTNRIVNILQGYLSGKGYRKTI